MSFDPQGAGAGPEDMLVRRGKSWESRNRLSLQAAQAESAGVAHGVSVTSPESNNAHARDATDAVQAIRSAFEDAGFIVRFTPTRKDPDHHTILLPDPLTDEWAEKFNTVLGRSRKS